MGQLIIAIMTVISASSFEQKELSGARFLVGRDSVEPNALHRPPARLSLALPRTQSASIS